MMQIASAPARTDAATNYETEAYTIDRGRLVVIPEANKVAVERGNNHGPRGDLNRQFPMGAEPRTPIARAIWNEVLRVDPDYLLDLLGMSQVVACLSAMNQCLISIPIV